MQFSLTLLQWLQTAAPQQSSEGFREVNRLWEVIVGRAILACDA